MKRQDLTTVAAIAVGTAVLTVLTFWTGPLEAGGEPDANGAKYVRPKLACAGVEMTLATPDGVAFKAGEKPVLELTAVNTTSQPAELSVDVAMSAMAPTDALSRTPAIPARVWHCDQSIALKPRETRVFTLATGVALPANRLISVALRESKPAGQTVAAQTLGRPQVRLPDAFSRSPGVVALSFSTAAPQK